MKKLFFALITSFLFVASSWGQCTDNIFTNEFTLSNDDSKEFSIDSDVYKTITFQAKKSGGTLPLVIEIYDSQNKNIGTKEIKVGDLSKSYKDFSISSDSYIRKIKFSLSWWATGNRTITNIKGIKLPKIVIPTAPINFVNGANEHTINIDYSALTSDLTAELETKDGIITLGSPYGTSTSSVAIAYAGCTNGTVGLKVSYNPINCSDYTNKIIFKQNGTTVATINVSSTYNRYVRVNTNDINFTDIKPGEKSEKVIGIDYAYQSEDVIATLENADSPFSLSTAIVAKGDCSVGNIPLTLTYKPSDCNNHTNKIIFTQGGKTIATINVGSTYNSYVNMKTDDISFLPTMELGTQKTISVDVSYAFISEILTATLENADSPFSLSTPTAASASSVIVAKNNCTAGSTTLIITFDPKTTGIYSNVIKLSNGSSLNVSGECSATFDTEAANFKVEKASYTSIKLRWNAVPGASGYRIVNQTNGATYTVDANTTSLNATGLKMDTNYSFVFYALFNDNITSLNEATVSATTLKKEGVVIEDCSKFYENYDEKKQTIGVVGYNKPMIYDNISITGNLPSYKVRFRAKMTYGSVVGNPDLCMYVKLAGMDNYENVIYWEGRAAGLDDTYREYLVEIPQNTIAIKFDCDENGATLSRYVDDLYIFSENILEADKTELDFGEVKPNEYKDISVNLTYSNIAKLEAMLDSEFFTIQSFNETAACTDGTQEVVIRFQPTACFSEYEESLTFFNGQELAITLKGKLKRNPGTVKEITWTGAVDTNWDNRANWKKADRNVLSAADVLDAKLKVNIPADLAKYPVIPDVSTPKAFKEDRDKACDCAQVNAGDNATATMIADKIYMKSGAALVGVETLKVDGVSRYREVQMDFTPERYNSTTGFYEWSLVGPVVKPWDEEGNIRDVVSGDYYLNDLPHVKMHEAVMIKDGENYIQTWDNSFASLTVKIPHNKAFAIRMPNQYGRNSSGNGIPASIYNKRNDTEYDAKKNVTFTFTGRFYNEAGLPEYTGLTPEVPVLLNNTYPANIDADMLQSKGYGTIQCYEGHSFVDVTGRTDAVISSGYGFIFTPNVAEFTIPSDCFQTTKVINNRNAEAEVPSLRLQLKNENVDGVYSAISISHDELKDDAADYAVDAPKLFNDMESNLADLYVMRYDSKWAGLTVHTVEESLPLGIKVRTANQKYKFNLLNSNLDCDIILEDRQEAKEYNLSAGEVCEVSNLVVGDCRGRFYLKTSESAEEDEDVTTDISESEVSTSIDIYVNGNSVTVSSNDNIRNIIVSDLSGRQMNYNVNGQYIVLDLPVASGIYTINVIGDNTSRIAKVKQN